MKAKIMMMAVTLMLVIAAKGEYKKVTATL
jgi:hypothetical protein